MAATGSYERVDTHHVVLTNDGISLASIRKLFLNLRFHLRRKSGNLRGIVFSKEFRHKNLNKKTRRADIGRPTGGLKE